MLSLIALLHSCQIKLKSICVVVREKLHSNADLMGLLVSCSESDGICRDRSELACAVNLRGRQVATRPRLDGQ